MASNEEDATLLIDDLDTLSYFSPTLTRKPSPLPPTSTIISSLLSSAGLPATYPPADLTTLITAIETTSTFDTLRRNGLLLYLLIDVSTSPSVIDAFCNARLIPTFWRTSVEAYHAFDHGQYARAMPSLSKENAEPYTELVLRRLDPREDAKLARWALQFVKVARPDVVHASKEAQQTVLIAKAIGEGLPAALELARTIDPAASASAAVWPWLFNKRRPKLLAEFVRLPLNPQEVQGARDFALAPTSSCPSASTAAAQRRAIDALLLRLLNAGQVVEALRLDGEAEEHGLGGDEEGDEASAVAVKQRREMLRLARQSLPATLRLELDDDDGEEGGYEGGINGRASGQHLDGAGDVSMSGIAGGSRAPSRTKPTLNTSRTAATPSSPLVTLPRSASRSLALASQSPLAGSGSSSSFTGSPRPQPRGGLPLSRAGYASPSPRPATSALPSTAAAAAASRGDTSMQASTSFSSSSNAGPYARLAAQLASAQPQSAGANDSGSGSALLSSLLPQKRAALSSASLASRAAGGASVDTIMAPAAGVEGDVSMDRTMTPPPPQPSAGSAFEVPKRRYVAKASTEEEGQQSVGRARGQRQRSQAADATHAKARAQRGVPSPHKKQRQMERDEQDEQEEEAPVQEKQSAKTRLPRSKSTMPGSFFGDDEEMHEGQGQHEEEPEEQQAEVAKSSTRGTRTSKGKQSNAAATTARRGSKDAATSTTNRRRKTATTSSRRLRETSTTSSLAATSTSAHEDEGEGDETYAPPTTRRMTRSQSVMSAISDAAGGGGGETYDTWTSGTTGDDIARDPLYEQREEEEEEEDEEEGEEEDGDGDGQQGGRRRTRTSSSGGRKTTKQPTATKRTTRQRSAQPTSSTPKASPQKRRTATGAAAGTASATSTPRRSTRRGGA